MKQKHIQNTTLNSAAVLRGFVSTLGKFKLWDISRSWRGYPGYVSWMEIITKAIEAHDRRQQNINRTH